jgi:hypothetical protein
VRLGTEENLRGKNKIFTISEARRNDLFVCKELGWLGVLGKSLCRPCRGLSFISTFPSTYVLGSIIAPLPGL